MASWAGAGRPSGAGKGTAGLRPTGLAAGGVKRPAQPGGAPPGKAAKPVASQGETILVYCTSDRDEIGIRTLVGEYKEEGANHGRKFYKKTQKIPGHEDINVFLYFWDERDGPSFSGWWFGNQVGGAQVWSRNAQATQTPPKSGWTIPWDGEVKKELVVAPKVEGKQAQAIADAKAKQEQRKREEEAKQSQNTVAEWEERVEQATLKAAEVEVNVTEALEAARELLQSDFDDSQLQDAQRELATQATALAETQRTIAMEGLAAQKAPAPLKAEMTALGQRMRQLQATVKEELGNLKNGKLLKIKQAEAEEKRIEEENRERELEEGYAKQLEEMLPPAMEKTDAAEDEVEKVAIAAAPLQIDTTDDLRPIMLQAIKETEQRVRAAQASIGEARRYISGKLTQVGRFAPNAKKTAVEEFTALQTRLTEAQNKLNPYKTVRQDFEQRAQAKKLHEELSGKVSSAEIEVEKAAMMTAPLGGDSAEGIKETEAALSAAQSAISQTLRLIDSKLKIAKGTGPLHDEIKALQERAKAAQEKLDEVRRTVKETQVRVAADQLLREVSEKVSNAEDELQRMAEAELPFLRGEKTQDIEALIGEAEQVASKVHSSIAEAQAFVARKLVEVARFTEGPAKTVKEEIDMMQKRLEDGRERLQQFRSSTGDRKRTHLLEEVEVKVKAAEDEVLRMAEAAQGLTTLGAAGETATEGGREAVEQANLAERAAQASLVVARKHLLQKTADLKKLAMSGGGSGSELGRLQTRVNNVQQEIAKIRNTIKEAEERLRVKTMLNEVALRLHSTEGEVDKVAATAVAAKGDEQLSSDQVERMEKATASAQTKLTATAKLVDVKLKSASGVLREELSAMRSKISAAEKKLATVIAAAKEHKERLVCSEIVSEAEELVLKAEAELGKTGDAELPFLKGLESLPAQEAIGAVAACEAAAGSAQKAIAAARTFVVTKLVDVKDFAQAPADACSKELAALQKRLDNGAARLAELKKDTAERKRTTQMQASGQKVSNVEAAVQKLANTMTKFPEDRLGELSQDDARKICEEIASTEAESQAAVADARKFLAMRVQDAKNSKDASKGPMTADLAKLQARLTQCQVELAKLSKQCTEREQRFVAQKLVQDANSNTALLQKEVDYASSVAQDLLADDRTELLASTFMSSITSALISHLKASGTTADALFKGITKGKSAKADEFADWLGRLQELTGSDEACLTEERAREVASRIAGSPGGAVSAAAFKALLRDRYLCAEGTPAFRAKDGDEEACKIEAGEGLELLEPLAAGSARGHFALARDGAKVWVSLESVRASPPFAGRLESIEAFVKAVHQRCTEASQGVDQKTVDLAHVKQGPLVEVKTKLQEIRTVLSTERAKIDALKKRASAAKAAVLQQKKDEVQKVQDSKCKDIAAKVVSESTAAVEAAEAKAAKVIESAKAGSAEKLQKDLTISQLDDLKSAAEQALAGLGEARAVVTKSQEAHEGLKGSRNLLLESRVELTKLTSRVNTAERKLRTATNEVRTAYDKVVKTATLQARGALRAAARKSGKSADELFDQVSAGKGEISEQQFAKFVATLPDHGLTGEQVSLVYKDFGQHGLRKSGFAKALQEFCICDRATEIGAAMDRFSDKVRQLQKGELFEVLEGPVDSDDGLNKRVRGRALRDGAAGWVTLKAAGGEDPAFLRPMEKPFLCVTQPASMYEDCTAESAVVRPVQQDEVLELLEGPRPLEAASEMALRVSASTDGKAGWITLKDSAGNTLASPAKNLYVCKSTIAMTDGFDIQNCKVLRKVDVGEALEVVGGNEQTDTDKDISRMLFRAVRDGKEGWVSLKGNQGTVYVAPSDVHVVSDKAMPLRSGASKESAVVRQLEAGEVLHSKEPAKEVRPEARMGARARTLEDGKAGWIVFAPGPKVPIKPWRPKYVCKASVDVTASLALQPGAMPVRKAEPGEVFRAVEGPAMDPVSGLRRLRIATAEDGAIGWATIRDAEGKAALELA